MKIIQFVRPMFLTALGLHVSLLFVPIGGDSEPDLLEEDVPLAELTEDARKAVTDPLAPSKLPVPDLNVKSESAKAGTPKPVGAAVSSQAKPRPAPRKVAPPIVAAAQPAQIRPNSSVAASSASTASNSTRSASNNSAAQGNSGAANSGSQAADDVVTPASPSVPGQPTSFVPDFSQDDEDSQTDTTAIARDSNDSDIEESATADENTPSSELIAAASQNVELPTSLEDSVLALAEALIYRADETSDDRAEQMREAWIGAVSRQASRLGNIERVEPSVVSELTLAYPMDAAVIREGRSLNVCLDEAPSDAEIGLLFTAQGELAVEPEVLRGTGYEALNQELISMLKQAKSFPEDRGARAYVYEIEVEYDAQKCVDLDQLKG